MEKATFEIAAVATILRKYPVFILEGLRLP